MKRTERHHLKENELANLAASARESIEGRGQQLTLIVAAVAVVAALAGGYYWFSGRSSAKADALLAEAMKLDDARIGPPAPPGTPGAGGLTFTTERERHQTALTKFKIVADEYPDTPAGIFARYREAATFMALGSVESAGTSFQMVIDQDANGLYGRMAKLGLAEVQAQTGQYDPAIATFKELSQQKDGPLPVDGVLMRLGRTYLDAGKRTEAEQTFNQLITEYPESPFAADARRALDTLKRA
jgi:predicted negative regulator of RcsB-dependent stress response